MTDRDICFGNKLYANELWSGIEPLYILTLYQATAFYDEFAARMTGIIGGIARSEFLLIPIPVPPQDEQVRIVARVDELMGLCDRLGSAYDERKQRRDRLVRASMHALSNYNRSAREPASSLYARATFVIENLARLKPQTDKLYP